MKVLHILAAACAVVGAPHATTAQDLERPSGWLTRFDQAGASEADLELFVSMPPGWHVTSGPSGIYWTPDDAMSGEFRLELEVFLFDPEGRREAFGLFFGGSDLEAAGQAYSYFLIRDGGEYIVKARSGTTAPTLLPWTPHDAIRAWEDRDEDVSVRNVLAIEAGEDTVRFFVNGDEVADLPRADLSVDGIFGFRVNHGLDLHISKLEATPVR